MKLNRRSVTAFFKYLLAFSLVIGGITWWMNRDTRWDAGQAIAQPGSVTEPRVGVIVVALVQPSEFNTRFWRNIVDKLLNSFIPWPINVFVSRDKGVVLMDPDQAYAMKEFKPRRLADIDGREKDVDGIPWIEKYHRGDVDWKAPSASTAFDMGYFIYPDRNQEMPTPAAKIAAKARYIYYAPLKNQYLPHGDQTIALGKDAIALLRAAHPQIVAGEFVDAFDPEGEEAAVNRVLDSGVDVLVLGSGQPIYSDFEELKGSYSKIHKIVDQWEAMHFSKRVRIVVAPWMASEASYDQMWLDHFAATVPQATAPGQSALGIVSLHGLPVRLVKTDSWARRWPATSDRLRPRMAEILKAKGYATVRVETGFEAFADSVDDPDNKLLSVNELYKQARKAGAAVAVALPIEFLAENTDTLFAHQAYFFDGIGGYRTYAPPPLTQDWMQPYVRRLVDGKTMIIYAGAIGGAKQPQASAVLATAMGRVFPVPKTKTP